MRAGPNDRVRRQLMRDAVSDNLETIRGLPPRSVRPVPRAGGVWTRRLPLLLIPVTLLGASYLVSEPPILRTVRQPTAAVLHTAMIDSTEPVKAAESSIK